jgi:hypothetical protein
VIAALARHYGLRRSALSSALFDEVKDAAYAAQVGAWYESLPATNRLGQQHLAALLAWTDLEARATFVSLIAHQPRPEVFQAQDIAEYCSRESNVPDPRWLLPFLAPLLDPAASQPQRNRQRSFCRAWREGDWSSLAARDGSGRCRASFYPNRSSAAPELSP